MDLSLNNLQSFIPFRHTFELFTKSPDFDVWTFDDIDYNEFTLEMRTIKDWEWIISLDREYNHGTMICCMSETIHGNRFSIHSKKNYKIHNNLHLDISMNIEQNGYELLNDVQNKINTIENRFPERFSVKQNVEIKPERRVCIYTMNCLKYTHIR